MSSELIFKYKLDLTGVSVNNKVIREPHSLGAASIRTVVLNNGSYYGDSLVVTDSEGNQLQELVDYRKAQLYQEPTIKSGKPVYAILVIINPNLVGNIYVTYQVVGDIYSFSTLALRETLADIDLSNATINWDNILGIPTSYPPAPHIHSIGDMYGFEHLMDSMESVRRAILTGDEAAIVTLLERINVLSRDILPPANLEDAVHGIRDDVVLTPKTAKLAFDTWAGLYIGDPIRSEAYQVHLALSNPHKTDSTLVGLNLLENSNPATLTDVVSSIELLAV